VNSRTSQKTSETHLLAVRFEVLADRWADLLVEMVPKARAPLALGEPTDPSD